ncbi:MAG: VWA domain-containing protein, partial [Bacteroidetes bacterium]|nr:VWA domain-containing protein [Bacteroidota bacterium]
MRTITKMKDLKRSAGSAVSRCFGFVLGAFWLLQAGNVMAQVPERTQTREKAPTVHQSPVGTIFSAPDILNVPEGMNARDFAASLYATSRGSQRTTPSNNPDLPEDLVCQNLDVIFVLDESGSINSSEAASVRTGALALANALNNSGANLRLVEFNTTASVVNLGMTEVNNTFISRFNSYLTSSYNSQSYNPYSSGSCVGWTNWDDALEEVGGLDGDLVIFFTDGNPTAYNTNSGNCNGGSVQAGSGSSTVSTALSRAVTEANTVKGQGKHIFCVGVGSDLNVSNLQDISGSDNFANNGNIFTDDYSVGDFNDLAAKLTAAVNTICGTELEIEKTVNHAGVCSGEEVIFTITVTNTGG